MKTLDAVAVIGVGLLGGSLGLALKKKGLAGRVRGVGHRQSTLDTALALGAVDEVFLDARAAASDADLIVICTPAGIVSDKLDEILPYARADAVVTDVASTKAAICRHARTTWPAPLRFAGSHPMAGSEKFGPEHAFADLYAGCVTVVEKRTRVHAPDAHETVCALWRSLGARVIELEPERHDAIVARTSHTPHIVAACLALAADADTEACPLAGGGFRDTTRIAAGRAEVWRDVCLTNRDAILDALDGLEGRIQEVIRLIRDGDEKGLEDFFRSAQEARKKVLGE